MEQDPPPPVGQYPDVPLTVLRRALGDISRQLNERSVEDFRRGKAFLDLDDRAPGGDVDSEGAGRRYDAQRYAHVAS